MSEVGRVSGIFRYPVKSMLGEELDGASLGESGIPGDRAWGVRDEVRADFFVGKRSASLMSCAAWYADTEETPLVPQIRLPDGETFRADAEGAAERVGRVVGRDVTLWPVVSEARQAVPREDVPLLDEMQKMMAREEGEPQPDFSNPAPELIEFYARNGPFFDAYPLLLLTQRSIDSLASAAPESRIEARRFRPNLLLETAEAGSFPEQEWIGRRARIGSAVVSIQSTCIRCVMTTHGFADIPKDPRVMRTLVREAEGNLGVYAMVEEPGDVRRGDAFSLLD
ncbi:MAG: MOSC domain-containing protein [Deltaproteobacteria bacterium]|nr:MOSC domain-containing protein [Deltaproteobacteria bacterium]MBW2361727.1 MOSC domain-containing protein [Deltaproteobacteria bacterium]